MAENDQMQLYSRFGKKIPPGTVLFQEGDRGEEMFVLQSGKVKISKQIRGVEKILATVEKGDFFGEMAILNDKPRSATAMTIEECEMLVIDRETFDTLLRGNVEIAIRFIKRLADRLRETNDQLEALMIKDNTSRLVSILAGKVKEQKKIDEFFITIDGLAGLAGIENSQVRMIIEKLASVSIVELSNEKVYFKGQDQVDLLMRLS
ncbi:MAG: cyclic nucleotide-binding domain-containing protein [Nitrospirae bacterium]|nr:cyclic nucleotide-binding domain-containing protein [Nitrospirota bacterium]